MPPLVSHPAECATAPWSNSLPRQVGQTFCWRSLSGTLTILRPPCPRDSRQSRLSEHWAHRGRMTSWLAFHDRTMNSVVAHASCQKDAVAQDLANAKLRSCSSRERG